MGIPILQGAMLVRAFVWRTDAHMGRWEQTPVIEF